MQRENNRTKLGGFVLFFPLAGVGNSESGSVLTFMQKDRLPLPWPLSFGHTV